MAKKQLYVERRQDGDYNLIRGSDKNNLGKFPTQEKAIDAGKRKEPDHDILVERVRNTKRGKRDKWRSV
jgi:hypothetical protein